VEKNATPTRFRRQEGLAGRDLAALPLYNARKAEMTHGSRSCGTCHITVTWDGTDTPIRGFGLTSGLTSRCDTILDLVLLAVMLISGLLAMVRGFMREILSIAAWGAAAGGHALRVFEAAANRKTYSTTTPSPGVVVAGVFVGTLMWFPSLRADFRHDPGFPDRGARPHLDSCSDWRAPADRGRRVPVLQLAGSDSTADWVTGAKSRVVLQGTGDWLMSLLPDDPENTS